jgi:hypothetical protein
LERRKGSVVANIGRDEPRAKLDRGDPFVLLEVLAPPYYRHPYLPGASNLPPRKVAEMAPGLLPDNKRGTTNQAAHFVHRESSPTLEPRGL